MAARCGHGFVSPPASSVSPLLCFGGGTMFCDWLYDRSARIDRWWARARYSGAAGRFFKRESEQALNMHGLYPNPWGDPPLMPVDRRRKVVDVEQPELPWPEPPGWVNDPATRTGLVRDAAHAEWILDRGGATYIDPVEPGLMTFSNPEDQEIP